jgi:transaldolase
MLFSREQYLAAAEAHARGNERRLAAGRNPRVASVASLFISRWDVAVHDKVPERLRNTLGIAVGKRVYKSYCDWLESPRWKKLAAAGAQPQRLLWASTGTKDPAAADTMYVEALAAPDTINTLPEKTLHAFADHGRVINLLPRDGGDAEPILGEIALAGINEVQLATRLQQEGTQAFAKSWQDLLKCLAAKGAATQQAGAAR